MVVKTEVRSSPFSKSARHSPLVLSGKRLFLLWMAARFPSRLDHGRPLNGQDSEGAKTSGKDAVGWHTDDGKQVVIKLGSYRNHSMGHCASRLRDEVDPLTGESKMVVVSRERARFNKATKLRSADELDDGQMPLFLGPSRTEFIQPNNAEDAASRVGTP